MVDGPRGGARDLRGASHEPGPAAGGRGARGIIPVGGAEEKMSDARILRRFVDIAGREGRADRR